MRDLTRLRHPEWAEHRTRWQWLADSLEGGDRYRYAVYGTDRRGFPIRNLLRHKREYPAPGETHAITIPLSGGPVADSTDDDYSLRLVRTPVPDYVGECVRRHLGRIYRHEVRRSGPPAYIQWTANTDGAGTDIDAWMRHTVAPLLMAVGCLDIIMDHPPAPPNVAIRSRSQRDAYRLDAVVARVIMPTDVVWWRLEGHDYAEAVVLERAETERGLADRYRHWTATDWTLYDADGGVLAQGTHPYGRVPMIRLMLARKPRCENVGWTPLEAVAERQREAYNRESELVLSDVLQAHPLLQGPPPDADGTISIGPQWLLAKKELRTGAGVAYEGYQYLDPPKGGADSLRQNIERLRAEVEASQGLAKPSGSLGMVAQSGLSKAYDHATYNDILSMLADALQVAEVRLGRLATLVASDGADTDPDIRVHYSRVYDLRAGAELASLLSAFQNVLQDAGRCPALETRVLMSIVRDELLPGMDDETYREIEAEVKQALAALEAERKLGAPDSDMMPDTDTDTDTDTEETYDA